MIEYILEQSSVIRVINDSSYKLNIRNNYHQVIIAASGSSLNAALLAISILKLKKDKYIILNPHDLRYDTDYLSNSDNLLIGVSQTGGSVSTLECMQLANQNNLTTISLTSGVNNPLANEAKVKVDICCGQEPIGPKTKGYLASVLSLIKVIAQNIEMIDYDISSLYLSVDNAPKYISMVDEWINNNQDWILASCYSMVGYSLDDSLCKEGALKILETHQVPIMNYPAEEFMHGPHRTIVENSKLIVLDSQDDTHDSMYNLVEFAKSKGCDVLVISTYDDYEDAMLVNTWVDILLLLQILAALLPAHKGINPSDPVHPEFAKIMNTRL